MLVFDTNVLSELMRPHVECSDRLVGRGTGDIDLASHGGQRSGIALWPRDHAAQRAGFRGRGHRRGRPVGGRMSVISAEMN